MRVGLIGTMNNTGIGHIAWGFAEHLNAKALLVDNKPFAKFPERFPNRRITREITWQDLDWLFEDIDVLFTIETPYKWEVYKLAKDKGIKTVFMPMIEWLDRRRPELKYVDLFVCPSSYTYDLLPNTNRLRVPCEVPIDLTKFNKRNVKNCKVFLHNSGHGGIGGRNSTKELMQAIPLVKSQAEFIIRSQFPLHGKSEGERVSYLEGNVQNYWDLYEEGDVWFMPWKYGVGALGLQESLGAGMLPVITRMKPFTDFMPEELMLIPNSLESRVIHAGQKELYATHAPVLIARKIDELYSLDNKTLGKLRKWADITRQEWSWDTWKPKYLKAFEDL